jgi:hypothetical protein
MDPRDLLKYDMDVQLTAYIYGLSKQLTLDSRRDGGPPIRIEGAIIDVLVKTATSQFAREDFSRSLAEMAEFELEFVEYGNDLRTRMERVEAGEDWKIVFPKNTDQCFKWGTCTFRDLCLKDSTVRRAAYTAREPDYVDEALVLLEKNEPKGEA